MYVHGPDEYDFLLLHYGGPAGRANRSWSWCFRTAASRADGKLLSMRSAIGWTALGGLQHLMCGFAVCDLQGHLIRNANSVTFERNDLFGVIRQHSNVSQS